MKLEVFIPLLDVIAIIFILSALIIFSTVIYFEIKHNKNPVTIYSFFFALFLGSWMIIELLSHSLFLDQEDLMHIVHLVILIVLAFWMNLRFIWAQKRARELSIDPFEMQSLYEKE